MTGAEYQAAIPPWCEFQTTQEHIDYLGLCWGITSELQQKEGIEYCRGCEYCIYSGMSNAPRAPR